MKNFAGRMLIAVLLWGSACGSGWAAESYKMTSVALLQSNTITKQRITDPSAFAAYIQDVNAAVTKAMDAQRNGAAAGVTVVMAVRPGGASRAWVSSTSKLPADISSAIASSAGSVKSPEVSGGTVVFAINASLWGGEPPQGSAIDMPEEWSSAVAKAGGKEIEITQVVDSVWPAQ